MLTLYLCLCFCACSQSDHIRKNQDVKANDFEVLVSGKNADIKYSRNLPPNVNGVNSDKVQLALVEFEDNSENVCYEIFTVDNAASKVALFDYGSYVPLQIVKEDYINHFSYNNFIDTVDIIYGYIEQYGMPCFDKIDTCKLFIKRLTKNNKLISVENARNSIEYKITSKSNELAIYQDVKIIFEDSSAVPEFYAFKDADDYWRAMDSKFNKIPGAVFESYGEIKNYLTKDTEETSEKIIDSESSDTTEKFTSDTEPESHNSYEKADVFYRVRKSANDTTSQIGAFNDFNYAKALADKNKKAGYKVYDNYGNLIYIP